jgi:hypothetical protein
MKIGNSYFDRLILILCICIATAALSQCANHSQSAVNLPRDILGISVGMNKQDVTRRLEEIAVFERDERKRQQVWKMKDASRYSHVAVGYDEKNQIRYITAFVDKALAKERIRFTDIGDLSKAKKEITEPHHRYTWEVPAIEDKPGYFVIAYGSEPEFLSSCSLNKTITASESED